MSKNVLYLGNNLLNAKTNVSYMSDLIQLLEGEDCKVISASSYDNKVLRLLDMVKTTLKYAATCDLVLIDTYSTQNFYYAVVVSQLCKLKQLSYVPILHGGNLPRRLKQNPKLCQLIFKPAKCLVAPSLYLKAAFEQAGYTDVVYIPNSINLKQYPFKPRPFERLQLLWVRSFSEIYNPKLAIRVLKQLQDLGEDAELCMVGPDTEGLREQLKAYAREQGVKVTFKGKLTKTQWKTLAIDYNLFINTTNFDNMPVSVIEAMALGLTVVSTDVGGMPFLIAHSEDGLLVPPNDAKAFVTAILYLKDNPDFTHRLAVQARKKVEGFDWELVKWKWMEVLR